MKKHKETAMVEIAKREASVLPMLVLLSSLDWELRRRPTAKRTVLPVWLEAKQWKSGKEMASWMPMAKARRRSSTSRSRDLGSRSWERWARVRWMMLESLVRLGFSCWPK